MGPQLSTRSRQNSNATQIPPPQVKTTRRFAVCPSAFPKRTTRRCARRVFPMPRNNSTNTPSFRNTAGVRTPADPVTSSQANNSYMKARKNTSPKCAKMSNPQVATSTCAKILCEVLSAQCSTYSKVSKTGFSAQQQMRATSEKHACNS